VRREAPPPPIPDEDFSEVPEVVESSSRRSEEQSVDIPPFAIKVYSGRYHDYVRTRTYVLTREPRYTYLISSTKIRRQLAADTSSDWLRISQNEQDSVMSRISTSGTWPGNYEFYVQI